jgi:two-component system sensor histidine kinase TctE
VAAAIDPGALSGFDAGWPVALVLVGLAVGDRLRETRRRARLNQAVHELRRPLQTLVLCPAAARDPEGHAIRVALAALGDLDRAINGGPRDFAPRPVACRALVRAAVERWRGIAAASDRSLALDWRAGGAAVMADPERLAQALDNLIHNAILHGGLRIRIEASLFAQGVRIAVLDSGAARPSAGRRSGPRHGHGLRIVSAVAAEHGGRFLSRSGADGTKAILELPFAPAPLPSGRKGRRADERASSDRPAWALASGGGGDGLPGARRSA